MLRIGLCALALLFNLVSNQSWAQLPPGASWSFPSFSATGPFTITIVGGDMNQPFAQTEIMLGINAVINNPAPYPQCLYQNWNGSGTSLFFIPLYYLDPNGIPQYNDGVVNPLAKAFQAQLLSYYLTGKTLTRVDYYLLPGNNNICVLKAFF